MSYPGSERVLECLVLPIGQAEVLVPAVCVAEVVRYQPLAWASGPSACIGLLGWHEGDVPVIDLGLVADGGAQWVTHGRAIAVLQRTLADAAWPFWAVALSDLPRKRRVAAGALVLAETAASGCPGSWVHLGSDSYLIPDLAWLQREQLPPVTWSEPVSF